MLENKTDKVPTVFLQVGWSVCEDVGNRQQTRKSISQQDEII